MTRTYLSTQAWELRIRDYNSGEVTDPVFQRVSVVVFDIRPGNTAADEAAVVDAGREER